MTVAKDGWDNNAQKLVWHHVMAAKSGIAFAPDTSYEACKRGEQGPHTIAIAATLKRWGAMWAADMREAHAKGIEIDGKRVFAECMLAAEDEIRRYMANNHLTRAA